MSGGMKGKTMGLKNREKKQQEKENKIKDRIADDSANSEGDRRQGGGNRSDRRQDGGNRGDGRQGGGNRGSECNDNGNHEDRDRHKTVLPLKWSMTGMLVMGWLLPLVLISLCLLYFVSNMIGNQIEKTVRMSTDKAVESCEMQISAVQTASKNATYVGTIKQAYEQYQVDDRRYLFARTTSRFLDEQYKYDRNYLCTMVFLPDEPQYVYFTYNTYQKNNDLASAYNCVLYFKDNVQEEVLEMSPDLDTRISLLVHGDRLYMVRNLVTSEFKTYAVIVIEMTPQYVFEGLNSIWGAMDYEVYVDGKPLFQTAWEDHMDLEKIRRTGVGASGYSRDKSGAYAYRAASFGGQEILYIARLNPELLLDDVNMLWSMLLLVIIFMIPLIIMIFLFFNTRVNKPVAALVAASEEIAEGNYGHKVSENGNSREFIYLTNAFNTMSVELKYQFEQIYLEELALRDANIMALQSQINPHFLNNTLEIINWEARMNGNDKVSGMIEALATMLSATMNRKQKRFIPLSEELAYVDAYLYIIKQRFGDRFVMSQEVDERLLDQEIPMLIIQPIIENAVEHGMNGRRGGEVSLRIFAESVEMTGTDGRREFPEGTRVFIQVTNNGALSKEDQARIDYLLGDNTQDENEHHVSLGIRNVDRRLRIIYGEDCGLSIKSDNENSTVSTLIVKIHKDNNNSQ